MATERQIAANRKNAALSTGPSPESLAKTRLNATKHGLCATLPEADRSPEFLDRRAKWEPEFRPDGQTANWALDKAVAASLRIDRCEKAVDRLCDDQARRATLAWDQDTAVEAAATFNRLDVNPALASCQLQTTAAGAWLLIEAWLVLIAALERGDWSEADRSRALDLLGVSPDQREGLTPVDDPDAPDPVAFRRELASEEVARLEALREEALIPLDEMARRGAMAGDSALLSKKATLLLRYERDAWRRYREAIKELRSPRSTPASLAAAILPSRVRVEPPKPPRPSATSPSPTSKEQEERQALLAEAKQILAKYGVEPMPPTDPTEEDAWLDALEARLDAQDRVTERSQFVDFAVGQAS